MPPTTITDDRIATVEIMAEEGPITSRMVADEIGFSINSANELLKRMIRQKIIEKGNPKFINNNWCITYVLASSKPKQASMFSAAKRDALVAAFFGEYVPDKGAAWVF